MFVDVAAFSRAATAMFVCHKSHNCCWISPDLVQFFLSPCNLEPIHYLDSFTVRYIITYAQQQQQQHRSDYKLRSTDLFNSLNLDWIWRPPLALAYLLECLCVPVVRGWLFEQYPPGGAESCLIIYRYRIMARRWQRNSSFTWQRTRRKQPKQTHNIVLPRPTSGSRLWNIYIRQSMQCKVWVINQNVLRILVCVLDKCDFFYLYDEPLKLRSNALVFGLEVYNSCLWHGIFRY